MKGRQIMSIEKKYFGKTQGGEDVYTYTITAGDISVTLSEFGGAIVKLFTPDRNGKMTDIVCGYDALSDYENGDGYQGALIGRFGNRIGKGKFTLDGVDYSLYCNNGANHLHGGKVGFSHKVWKADVNEAENKVTFSYFSADGEENYPGNLHISVEYAIVDGKALSLTYRATTDKSTPVNFTNHSYFNLGGYASGKIFDHIVKMDADRFLPTDAGLIPTGEILPTAGTAFDFTEPKSIGRDFDLSYEPMRLAGGYDHCIVFKETADPMAKPRVIVTDEKSGRRLSLYTTLPCMHFYTGNFLTNAAYPFKGGYPQAQQNAFCLETENMPDSMNHEGFTNCILHPDEEFFSKTVFAFDAV